MFKRLDITFNPKWPLNHSLTYSLYQTNQTLRAQLAPPSLRGGLKSFSSEQANGFCFICFLNMEVPKWRLLPKAACVCINIKPFGFDYMNHSRRVHLRGDLSHRHRFRWARNGLHRVLRRLNGTPWLLPWRIIPRFILLLRCLLGLPKGYTFLYHVNLIVSRGLASSSTGTAT